ncbi:hypothetical protein AVEN_22704-1, partial [Araneus ventricosus]
VIKDYDHDQFGLYFDGQKYMTLLMEDNRRKVIIEEHISLVKEPGSGYIGRVSVNFGRAQIIGNNISTVEEKTDIQELVGLCNEADNNIYHIAGPSKNIPSPFKRALFWLLREDSFSDSDSNNPPANAIKNIVQNDYVVIKLAGKKIERFYVGVIISQDAFDEYTVKFMRKCGKDKSTFPENDDIAEVGSSNIVNVLSQTSLNKR